MSSRSLLQGLVSEASITLRFGVVGIAATLTHASVVTAIIEASTLEPRIANAIAFAVAFIVSFNGHFHWTFSKEAPAKRALWRFFVIALAGFGANTIVLSMLLAQNVLPESIAALVSILAVPVTTFLAARLWGFR